MSTDNPNGTPVILRAPSSKPTAPPQESRKEGLHTCKREYAHDRTCRRREPERGYERWKQQRRRVKPLKSRERASGRQRQHQRTGKWNGLRGAASNIRFSTTAPSCNRCIWFIATTAHQHLFTTHSQLGRSHVLPPSFGNLSESVLDITWFLYQLHGTLGRH